MKYSAIIVAALSAAVLSSCGGSGKGLADGASGNMEAYESGDVNAVVQAKPEIMIIPGDQTLKRFHAIESGNGGVTRDFQKYLLADRDARSVFSIIQGEFQNQNFPLNDLEQTLKQLDTRGATDIADGLAKDSKTILMETAQPDIILELDYGTKGDDNVLRHSNGHDTRAAFTLNAIDAYTTKVVATVTTPPVEGESKAEIVKKELVKRLPDFMEDIQEYFSDLLTRGREVTVRVNVDEGSNISLADVSAEGDTYSDYIVDYIKKHTVKGAYKLQSNTDNALVFTGVRIKLLNSDGTQYGVYDWTRDLARAMRKDLGVKVQNRAQGLGEVVLTLQGI